MWKYSAHVPKYLKTLETLTKLSRKSDSMQEYTLLNHSSVFTHNPYLLRVRNPRPHTESYNNGTHMYVALCKLVCLAHKSTHIDMASA